MPIYKATCSCRAWQSEGTADELEPLTRAHDDSPGRRHIVSIQPFGPERDTDFERARLAHIAEYKKSHPEIDWNEL